MCTVRRAPGDYFFFQNAHSSVAVTDVENDILPNQTDFVVHTKRCYKADEVLEQGTFLKDTGQCYCHCMRFLS